MQHSAKLIQPVIEDQAMNDIVFWNVHRVRRWKITQHDDDQQRRRRRRSTKHPAELNRSKHHNDRGHGIVNGPFLIFN